MHKSLIMDIQNSNLKKSAKSKFLVKRNSIEPRILCMLKMMKWVDFIRMDYAYLVFDRHPAVKTPKDYFNFIELAKEEVKYYHSDDITIEDDLMEKEREIYMEFKIYKDTYEDIIRDKNNVNKDKISELSSDKNGQKSVQVPENDPKY